jgi:hypothetical protein
MRRTRTAGTARRAAGLIALLTCAAPGGCGEVPRGGPALDDLVVTREVAAETQGVFPAARPVALGTDGRTGLVQLDVLLRVLEVQVPRTARQQLDTLWDYVREDELDARTRNRLEANGLRAGLGRTDQWETLRSILNQVEGTRAYELQPLRLPPATPLSLAIDRTPIDQTLFFIDADGVVSGDTWPASQKVLRISYLLDGRELGRLLVSIVPAIWQQSPPEFRYSEEEGWTAGPRERGRVYNVAGFVLPVSSEQFIVLAPGASADLPGMLGGAFLTERVDGELHDVYVFVRPEVRNVGQRR